MISSTLMTAQEGQYGTFVRWLEELGLGNFLRDYPLEKLVEWGWIVPQYRVVFPQRFFDLWPNYPELNWEPPEDLHEFVTLWDYRWGLDAQNEPEWFLDPIFRENEKAAQLLQQHRYVHGVSATPKAIDHVSGDPIKPYVDYFYKWQGYALLDVIRAADNLFPIYSTPDVSERVQSLVRTTEWVSSIPIRPEEILSISNNWGGYAELMTWIEHFKSYQNAHWFKRRFEDIPDKRASYHTGAKLLAQHLNISAEVLSDAIRKKLLVLTNDWMRDKVEPSEKIWLSKALNHLRSDVESAMTWLIILSGKTFEDYVEEWAHPAMGNWGWSKLEVVLPYDFILHQQKFVDRTPIYLKDFNEVVSEHLSFNKAKLSKIVKAIYRKNYPFTRFLAAFYELHENLTPRMFDRHGIDFRSLRPIDHYSLLAIHAERCLRHEVDSHGLLDSIQPDKQGLVTYIKTLSDTLGVSAKVTNLVSSNINLTKLYDIPEDPIGKIQRLKSRLPKAEHQLSQAFLCCILARNYFVHHDFMDNKLVKSDESAFLLKGILLTVLTFLEPEW